VRIALNDAAPLYRDAPETREARAAGARLFKRFWEEALPDTSANERALAGNLITTTMSAVGKEFSKTPRTEMEIQAYAEGLADMFCAYLAALGKAFPENSRPVQSL